MTARRRVAPVFDCSGALGRVKTPLRRCAVLTRPARPLPAPISRSKRARVCCVPVAVSSVVPFPRSVIFEACNFLGAALGYHGEFEDLVLRWELDQFEARTGAVHQRCRDLFRFLRDNPQASYEGRLISDLVVDEAARRISPYRAGPEFVRALERAGYLVEDGQLRRTLPEALDLPAADDEVHVLLNRYNLATPLGHLDQAIDSHARGNWAAANGQARSFLESLLDEIAYLTVPGVPQGQNQGEARREALANSQPAIPECQP